ncbi:MAG TPA: hypothetical protein VKG91_10105 [Roseiarcus sp.]|nr:hypothetical protein [Roseiarcus sp.]
MNIHAIEEINDASAQRPPVLAIRFGRGRTGGTTFLDFVIQRARRADRAVSIADGDTHNATLARFYPPGKPGGALQPRGSEVGDVAEWVTEVTSQMAADKTSMVLDMGGGDKVLEVHAKDLNLPEFCEAAGVQALAIYSIGPTEEDFDHAMSIYERGFLRTDRSLLVLNESLVLAGKSAGGAFDFVFADPRYAQIAARTQSVIMPKLACMVAMRNEALSFYDAAEGKRGKSGRPMSLGHRFMVKTWINRMEENLSQVEEWLP